MSDPAACEAELASRMDSLKADFREELKLAHSELRDHVGILSDRGTDFDPPTRARILRIAHRLAGSAGVFGYEAISDKGAALEAVVGDEQLESTEVIQACECLLSSISAAVLERSDDPTAPPQTDVKAGQKLTRITYVEDEADIREIGEIALGSIGGFEVDVCEDGYAAVARTMKFRPDLIILDVMMPGMDGVETYKRLRLDPTLKEVPVIFMTARIQEGEIAQYRALGCIDVIAKPFDPIRLSDQIEKIWRRGNDNRPVIWESYNEQCA